ncbi:MAG: hypothetical protein ACPLW7_06560, partial [Minisyncoccia bacterium]
QPVKISNAFKETNLQQIKNKTNILDKLTDIKNCFIGIITNCNTNINIYTYCKNYNVDNNYYVYIYACSKYPANTIEISNTFLCSYAKLQTTVSDTNYNYVLSTNNCSFITTSNSIECSVTNDFIYNVNIDYTTINNQTVKYPIINNNECSFIVSTKDNYVLIPLNNFNYNVNIDFASSVDSNYSLESINTSFCNIDTYDTQTLVDNSLCNIDSTNNLCSLTTNTKTIDTIDTETLLINNTDYLHTITINDNCTTSEDLFNNANNNPQLLDNPYCNLISDNTCLQLNEYNLNTEQRVFDNYCSIATNLDCDTNNENTCTSSVNNNMDFIFNNNYITVNKVYNKNTCNIYAINANTKILLPHNYNYNTCNYLSIINNHDCTIVIASESIFYTNVYSNTCSSQPIINDKECLTVITNEKISYNTVYNDTYITQPNINDKECSIIVSTKDNYLVIATDDIGYQNHYNTTYSFVNNIEYKATINIDNNSLLNTTICNINTEMDMFNDNEYDNILTNNKCSINNKYVYNARNMFMQENNVCSLTDHNIYKNESTQLTYNNCFLNDEIMFNKQFIQVLINNDICNTITTNEDNYLLILTNTYLCNVNNNYQLNENVCYTIDLACNNDFSILDSLTLINLCGDK